MKRPFPGMDPYLESHWRDVHHSLVTYASDDLNRKLPPDLVARINQQAYYETQLFGPVRHAVRRTAGADPNADAECNAATANVAEPRVYIPEPATEGYVEIREISTARRLITVIEILSPSTKSTPKGRKKYRKKQDELEKINVSLVEIDLLRRGRWIFSVPKLMVAAKKHPPYGVCTRRGWEPGRFEYHPLSLGKQLPAIPIPLRKTDEDVPLNLQSLVDQCYANGRYDSIDYSVDLKPPFDEADTAWVNDLLKSAGRR